MNYTFFNPSIFDMNYLQDLSKDSIVVGVSWLILWVLWNITNDFCNIVYSGLGQVYQEIIVQ